MQDHHSTHPPEEPREEQPAARASRFGLFAGIAAIALIAAGGTTWWTWQSLSSNPSRPIPATAPSTAQSPSPSPSPAAAEKTIEIYWLKDTGSKFELAPAAVKVKDSDRPADVLKSAFDQLLQQKPSDPALASTIPTGTKLLNLEVQPDGVHVDLSSEFTSGGGSAAMTGRVGQVIYTATTLNPSAPVWIAVNGKPLETLGGEGLELDQPSTRESFNQNFQL